MKHTNTVKEGNSFTGGELQALQNAVISTDFPGLNVFEKPFEDGRKTIKKYFLNINNQTISPVLDYENMNHFILGFSKAKSILTRIENNH